MSKLTLKLWISMMILILIALSFLWVVQTVLLEPYYTSLSKNEIKSKFNEISKYAKNYEELSEVIKSNIYQMQGAYIYSTQSKFISTNAVKQMKLANIESIKILLDIIENALKGKSFEDYIPVSPLENVLLIAIPIYFQDGSNCAVIIYQMISNTTSIQHVLKNQLFILSLVLIVASFILSLFIARIFTRPILAINKTVNRLAQGDLAASADVTQNDELGELSHSVDNLAKSLKKVEVLRKELIANVSHELKSPLSLIRGYAELVREISWKDEKERNENLNIIIDEAQRMSVMVNDILDYSQIQSGYLNLNTTVKELDYIINDSAFEAKKQAEKFSLEVIVINNTPDINVCVDDIKIHQVFRNLLNNAINHSKDGEKIKIISDFIEDDIRIQICNKGEPIPEEDRLIIWERYYRAQHQSGRKQGTGLGLSIVKTILDAHNMSYGIDYVDDNNIFWFEIPKIRIIDKHTLK